MGGLTVIVALFSLWGLMRAGRISQRVHCQHIDYSREPVKLIENVVCHNSRYCASVYVPNDTVVFMDCASKMQFRLSDKTEVTLRNLNMQCSLFAKDKVDRLKGLTKAPETSKTQTWRNETPWVNASEQINMTDLDSRNDPLTALLFNNTASDGVNQGGVANNTGCENCTESSSVSPTSVEVPTVPRATAVYGESVKVEPVVTEACGLIEVFGNSGQMFNVPVCCCMKDNCNTVNWSIPILASYANESGIQQQKIDEDIFRLGTHRLSRIDERRKTTEWTPPLTTTVTHAQEPIVDAACPLKSAILLQIVCAFWMLRTMVDCAPLN